MSNQYYEAIYILDIQVKEEGVDDILATIKQTIESLGGEFKGALRMERRRFERVAGHLDSGYYLGVNFELAKDKLQALKQKFEFDTKIYRQHYLCGNAPKAKAREKAAA